MLRIEDLVFRIQGRLLFDRATIHVPVGRKVGLVGRNGCGKSTLFRLIEGRAQLDAGRLELRARARIGGVAQETPGGGRSLIQFVLDADTEMSDLLREAETATDPHRIAEIHIRLADIDAHTAPARAASILSGLGFDDAAQARQLDDFSGGWRMRVALAAVLFSRPDLLMLDEPSNHLDLEATLWLTGFLKSYPGTLIVISHDRDLLNRVVDEIVHVDAGKLVRYPGDYDNFERVRRERLENQGKARERQLAERKRIQSFVDRFRAKATKARQAQSRLKMLARLEPVAAVVEDATATLDFPRPEQLPPPLITMDEVDIGYAEGQPVLKGLDLRIDMDDRIALIGANGNGKSTMIKLLAGRLKPLSGTMRRPSGLKVGYFAQHQLEELDAEASAWQHVARLRPKMTESQARSHVGRFGLVQDKAITPAKDLSGGEKARLVFSLISLDTPHMLLLDEPTNHLDVDSREALVQALNAFEGAVIIVSHDPHLIELVADRLWLVADGACRPFDGDLDDYRNLLLAARRPSRPEGNGRSQDTKRESRRDRAAKRSETADLRRAVKDCEILIERLGKEKSALETRLADPATYEGPAAAIAKAQTDLARVVRSIQEAEETWLAAHEKLEAATTAD